MRHCLPVYRRRFQPLFSSFFFLSSREISRVSFQIRAGNRERDHPSPLLICMPPLPQQYNSHPSQGHALSLSLSQALIRRWINGLTIAWCPYARYTRLFVKLWVRRNWRRMQADRILMYPAYIHRPFCCNIYFPSLNLKNRTCDICLHRKAHIEKS